MDEEELMDRIEEQGREIEALLAENNSLKAELKPIKALLETIRQQETAIAKLTFDNKALDEENEKLLGLAEDEKSMKAEIERLKQDITAKNGQINALSKQVKAVEDNYNAIVRAMPKAEDVERLTKTFKGAEKTISLVNFASIANSVFVGLFLVVTAFAAWQMYSANDNAERAAMEATAASKALYSREGYSVLQGTQAAKP